MREEKQERVNRSDVRTDQNRLSFCMETMNAPVMVGTTVSRGEGTPGHRTDLRHSLGRVKCSERLRTHCGSLVVPGVGAMEQEVFSGLIDTEITLNTCTICVRIGRDT